MSVRLRLVLVLVLLATLPALPATWLTRDRLVRALDLAFTPEMDAALEAGIRQTRQRLDVARAALQKEGEAWLAASDFQSRPARIADWTGDAADRVVLRRGESRLIVAEGQPIDPRATLASEAGAPPGALELALAAPGGWMARISRPVDPQWREDAVAAAEGLQLLRALRVERETLIRGFWRPILIIYGVTLGLALLAAWRLGRGITQPLARLVHATHRVGEGDWSARVVESGGGEFLRLSRSFNQMVGTLDAQSRRLVDLETMAGWREMARALAHEVKNPLTPIQLTVEEIRQRYDGDDAEYRALLEECTRIVIEEVDSLRRVVSRFREFSRPVELREEDVDLNALLRDVGALQRDMKVELDLQADLGSIRGDADRLRQVLLNLAENARKAQDGQTEARLCLRSRAREGAVEVVVEDRGPGIPADQRQRVFEPYHTGRAGGLGLGLSLVKGIVLAHGGSIEADEAEAGGAAIHMSFPAGAAARAEL